MKQIVIQLPDEAYPQVLALLNQLRALPQVSIEESEIEPYVQQWHAWKDAKDRAWEAEYRRRYGKELPR